MATQFFDRIAVETDGEGDAVVCVHGLGGSSNSWTPLMPALARHRVVRIDLPGSARSWRVEGPLSIERFVQAVLTVCTRLDIARAHFVGHSMGTIVCQHLAVQAPQCVRSLALFGPLLAPPDAARNAMRARADKARAEGVEGMQAIADAIVSAALSGDTRALRPVAVAAVRESLMRQDTDAYARSCEALADAQPAAVEQIKVPCLLVTGDEDAIAPPQSVRAISQRIAGSRVIVYPRCGHWHNFERPDECMRELRGFLSQRFA